MEINPGISLIWCPIKTFMGFYIDTLQHQNTIINSSNSVTGQNKSLVSCRKYVLLPPKLDAFSLLF